MTLVLRNITPNIDNSYNLNPISWHRLWELTGLYIQRFSYHIYAYSIILSVMLLTFGSLIFLVIHWSSRKLLRIPTPGIIVGIRQNDFR
jgi:hypothetical protein